MSRPNETGIRTRLSEVFSTVEVKEGVSFGSHAEVPVWMNTAASRRVLATTGSCGNKPNWSL